MKSKSIAIAIVGCGSVAENAYMPLAMNLIAKGKLSSVALYDKNAERSERLASKFRGTYAVGSLTDIAQNDEIEAVVILTSMNSHGELSALFLEAGKHVLVEKPMATKLEDAKNLVELAKAKSRFLICAPHVLLSPDFQNMHRRISDNQIGKPLLARARYGWDGPDWGKWFYGPGGGPLFDLGVYNVTSLTALLGPARKVSCMSTLTRPERVVEGDLIKVETDDTFQITIEHAGGALSTVTTAFGIQKYRGAAIEVYGLSGTIQMLGDDWAPDGLELWLNEQGSWQYLESQSRYWPWTDGLAHLVDCIVTGSTPYTTPEHAYHVLEVMLKSMTASSLGVTQNIDSSFAPYSPLPLSAKGASHRIHDRDHEDAQ